MNREPLIQAWRLTSVAFGTSITAFLLNMAIMHPLGGVSDNIIYGATCIRPSFWFHDIPVGDNLLENVWRLYTEAAETMFNTGIRPPKWAPIYYFVQDGFNNEDNMMLVVFFAMHSTNSS